MGFLWHSGITQEEKSCVPNCLFPMPISIGRKRQVSPKASSPKASSPKATPKASEPMTPENPMPVPVTAPDQSALIEQLRAELASKNAQLESANNRLQRKTNTRSKVSKRQEIVFTYPGIEEAFIFSTNKRESKMNIFNLFNEWRRCLTTLNQLYTLNPTKEIVELANSIHKLMIEADTTEDKSTLEFFSKKQKKGRLETDEEFNKRLNQAYNNYSKAYIIFLHTFGDKIVPYEPFIFVIQRLRETLEESYSSMIQQKV